MNVTDAVNEIVHKLQLLNDRELMTTGRTLQQLDLTWSEWSNEIAIRVNRLLRQGASQDTLDAIGALVIAHKIKLAEAEETRVDSGAAV